MVVVSVLFVLVIVFFIWFNLQKTKHINFSEKTLIPMADWHPIAKHSSSDERLLMSKHLLLESVSLLHKSRYIDESTIANLISIQGFNASNFINIVLGDTYSIRIRPEYSKELENVFKPAREYFALSIIAIVESSLSKELGLERLRKLTIESCGSDAKWELILAP